MSEIYAASITVSQGTEVPHATASVLHSYDGRETMFSMKWELSSMVEVEGGPGEWLYGVLSVLVQDFDCHVVTDATVSGLKPLAVAKDA